MEIADKLHAVTDVLKDADRGREEILRAFLIRLEKHKETGGVEGLLASLRAAGFSERVDSWVGGGPNLPIDHHDVERVLGASELEVLAQDAGVAPRAASIELAQTLPGLVDRLSPEGRWDAALAHQGLLLLQGRLDIGAGQATGTSQTSGVD